MSKLAEKIIQYRWAVIIGFIACTVVFGIQIRKAQIDPDMKSQLPKDMVSRLNTEKIDELLREFPSLAIQIPKILAQRLKDMTSAFYGFKEFCDRLPDAVLVSDNQGRVISWNTAA